MGLSNIGKCLGQFRNDKIFRVKIFVLVVNVNFCLINFFFVIRLYKIYN